MQSHQSSTSERSLLVCFSKGRTRRSQGSTDTQLAEHFLPLAAFNTHQENPFHVFQWKQVAYIRDTRWVQGRAHRYSSCNYCSSSPFWCVSLHGSQGSCRWFPTTPALLSALSPGFPVRCAEPYGLEQSRLLSASFLLQPT